MPEINLAVEEWLADHASRGCNPRSVADAMINAGFDPGVAHEAVHATYTGIQSLHPDVLGVEAGPGKYRYDKCPVASGNLVRALDRDVKVLMRCERPQIISFDGVFSPEECNAVIERSRPRLKPSTVYLNSRDRNRTSETASFWRGEDAFIDRLDQRIASLMNWPVANGEALQVQHYRLAGEYRSHYDYYPPRRSGVIARGRKGGQRGATLIVYLNDPFEGGATHFPNIGLSVAARQGGGLYFRYMNARRQLDPLTEHAGMPVLAGEKWIITKWMTEHPQEARIEAE